MYLGTLSMDIRIVQHKNQKIKIICYFLFVQIIIYSICYCHFYLSIVYTLPKTQFLRKEIFGFFDYIQIKFTTFWNFWKLYIWI